MKREREKRRLRRAGTLVLCLLLVAVSCPNLLSGLTGGSGWAYGTTESARLQKRAELVVFIRFKGEKEFVSGTTTNPVVSLLDGSQINLNEWYNAQNQSDYATDPSVNQYVGKVTYQGSLVKPVYATDSSTGMASYECGTSADDADFSDGDWFKGVQGEALKAIEKNLPDDVALDYNQDGKVDNCMFLWGPSRSSVLEYWLREGDGSRPWKGALGSNSVSVNNLRADSYTRNFIYSKSSFLVTGQPFQKVILLHEYMHTLGVPDLYEEDEWYNALIGSSSFPAGDWDIQSSYGAYGSTFLAQRVKYMKLGTFGEISASGTYTLHDVNEPNPSNGINGYKILTDRPNEYFAIEYRRGTTDGAAAKYGDGILVYRVKSDTRGNVSGDEEIHVYGRIAGFNSTASIADSSQGVGDPLGTSVSLRNNLEFTDGTNSGVCVRNVRRGGETITFDVILP